MIEDALTPRQIAVLRLLCADHAEEAVAQAFGIAAATVRHHLHIIQRRLGTTDLAAICHALATGAPVAIEEASSPVAHFGGCRIEHRDGDGAARVLATSAMESVAVGSARRWATALGRQGKTGTVAVVRSDDGRVTLEILVDGA